MRWGIKGTISVTWNYDSIDVRILTLYLVAENVQEPLSFRNRVSTCSSHHLGPISKAFSCDIMALNRAYKNEQYCYCSNCFALFNLHRRVWLTRQRAVLNRENLLGTVWSNSNLELMSGLSLTSYDVRCTQHPRRSIRVSRKGLRSTLVLV